MKRFAVLLSIFIIFSVVNSKPIQQEKKKFKVKSEHILQLQAEIGKLNQKLTTLEKRMKVLEDKIIIVDPHTNKSISLEERVLLLEQQLKPRIMYVE